MAKKEKLFFPANLVKFAYCDKYPRDKKCNPVFNTQGWENSYKDEDYIESVEYVLNRMPKHEKEILLKRFKDNMTLQAIGAEYGITKEAARLQLLKAVCLMQEPFYENVAIYTLATAANIEDNRRMANIRVLFGESDISVIGLPQTLYEKIKNAGIQTVSQLYENLDVGINKIKGIGETKKEKVSKYCQKFEEYVFFWFSADTEPGEKAFDSLMESFSNSNREEQGTIRQIFEGMIF